MSDTRGCSKASCCDRGDINAQICRNVGAYDKSTTMGRYGIRRTNPQVEGQIEWLTVQG